MHKLVNDLENYPIDAGRKLVISICRHNMNSYTDGRTNTLSPSLPNVFMQSFCLSTHAFANTKMFELSSPPVFVFVCLCVCVRVLFCVWYVCVCVHRLHSFGAMTIG
jgi:hypothetical protein